MIKTFFLAPAFFLFGGLEINAQFTENFDDGNFTADPVWIGNVNDFTVDVTARLQSNNQVANITYYLSTPSTLARAVQWELDVALVFNTSSTNYVDIFLTASESDLSAPATSGYFVRIGNTDDEISLYRKSGGGPITKIIDGTNGVTNSSDNKLRIKVSRDNTDQWILMRDITGTGNNYVTEGAVTDNVFSTASFFGILVKQSTASFFQKHFFDNILVGPYVPDIAPPEIHSISVLSASAIDVLFNEPVSEQSSQLITNYSAGSGVGMPITALRDAANPSLVHLVFVGNIPAGVAIDLNVSQITDLSGNTLVSNSKSFIYFPPYTPVQFDIVMDEILADPMPVIGLPDNEWVELRNTSSSPINLRGWRIADGSGTSGPMPAFILQPGSFVIVCSSNSAAALQGYGSTIGVTSFPSLDNEGEQLLLLSDKNQVIHSVRYHVSWYQNELKKNGGWSLEMIDINNPCSGISNWKASTDPIGGSPGRKNAVDAINKDQSAPVLVKAFTVGPQLLTLVFDEPLDSTAATATNRYTISDGIGAPSAVSATGPTFNSVNLVINTPLVENKVYTITVSGIADCMGNVIGNKNTARLGLSSLADSLDVVINEVLFDPPPTGTDYVEIYNRSNKIIDLKQTYIANRSTAGAISSITQLSAESHLLFPGDFMVVTENAGMVKTAYVAQNPDFFIEVTSIPSFNDDQSTVIILNAQGNKVDQLTYNHNWHFKLIDNREGVSLERIDYHAATQSADNWHSAATSVGYGTPTYKNSQYRINDGVQGEVKLAPEIVSPDNDGQDDFANIDYNFPEPGYVANITIFDGQGRVVRYLKRNALCGLQGNFSWDGLGENNMRLATGIYVVFTEVFNLNGQRKHYKSAIVLARRY